MAKVAKVALIAAVGAFVAGGLTIMSANPAHASRGDCMAEIVAGTERARAWCGGTAPDDFRAKATCRKITTGSTYIMYGPWTSAGSAWSYTGYCSAGYEIESPGWQWEP